MTVDPAASPLIGLLGGLGPLASARFIETIYRLAGHLPEQDQPRVVLLSDPSIPDRTEAILNGDVSELGRRMEIALRQLDACGAETFVVCCMTAHAVLDQLAPDLRDRTRSLVDVIVEELLRSSEPHLLVSTIGTRRARLFECHPDWARAGAFLVLPDDSDQAVIHNCLNDLKRDDARAQAAERLATVAGRYDVRGVVAGCTETHMMGVPGWSGRIIDPLLVIAEALVPGGPEGYEHVAGVVQAGDDNGPGEAPTKVLAPSVRLPITKGYRAPAAPDDL